MMKRLWNFGRIFGLIPLLVFSLMLTGCGDDGSDGADGADGADGLPGSAIVDISTTSDSILEDIDIVSEITDITIESPPVITFSVSTAEGLPVIGIGDFWEESNRFVRFTMTKLVPGTDGDPDSWVAYTRDTTGDGSTGPDYDTGNLVDNGDGTYTFTFNTDVAAVDGITYEPGLTHRVAGQIGSRSVAMEPQNLVYDFVPAGGDVTNTRNIAVMESCNECHDNLVFHGRRFEVEYCVQCHNPELAINSAGISEGDMAFMTHRIHAAGQFEVLEDQEWRDMVLEVTYPQELANCRKCHNGDDEATADGNNWKNVPSKEACMGCHAGAHPADQEDNSGCIGCHSPSDIEDYHVTANATANNPNLLEGQREIVYELIEVSVDENNDTEIDFRITSDGEPLDLTNLPEDLADPGRYPGFLLAYALPQSGIDAPADYNNLGVSAAQPIRVDINEADSLTCSGGICTAVINDGNAFPAGATMRAVGLQGYFRQDVDPDGDSDTYDYSLHTQSATMAVAGDAERRAVVDSAKCAACHEIFEGHGGNRNLTADGGVAICTMCHVPNLSSSGRTLDLTVPEDTQNLKEMIHGIHASAVRTTDYEHVRAFRGSNRPYNWAEVTFPAEVGNCALCHLDGTYELPLDSNILETTVRTTGAADGMDADFAAVEAARDAVPGDTDWVNSPVASTCFYCHDSEAAGIHMEQNGAVLSVANPDVNVVAVREDPADASIDLDDAAESCVVCHGDGKIADVSEAHGLD